MLSQQQQQQNPAAQHSIRMQMQSPMLNQTGNQGPPPNAVPPGQPLTQQQQWFKHQQLLQIQQQQQQRAQQFQAPPYPQRLPAIRQPHMGGYNSAFADQQQQYAPMQGIKPAPPPAPSPQSVMGPPISVQQQQMMQSVRSPPPIRSPQPNPSPRPAPSPRNVPVPSPRGPQPSPHELATASEMLLGQNHASLHPSPSGQNPDSGENTPMTPQDQLSKFVDQL